MSTGSEPPRRSPETLESRRLAEILVRLRGDGLLQGLVDLLTGSLAVNRPVCLVVDGVLFRGRLTNDEAYAEHLDSTIAGWLAVADMHVAGVEDSDLDAAKAQIGAALRGGFTAQARSRQRYESTMSQRLAALWGEPRGEGGYEDRPRVDDLPDELVADVVDYLAPRATLTLGDAQMLGPGGWLPVGVMRVIVSHVGAWWLGDGAGQ